MPSFDPTKIRVAAGIIYAGSTAPMSGSVLALTAGAPSDGDEIGLTQGESVMTFTVTYNEVMADQVLGPVAVFATQESFQLEFTMLEYAATQLNTFLQNSALTTDDVSNPNTDLFTIGNLADGDGSSVDMNSLVLVSPIPNTSPQRYTSIMLYQAFQGDPAVLGYGREKETLLKSKYKAISDLTRDPGDYMGQIVVERNP